MTDNSALPHVLIITQYYSPDPNFITKSVADDLSELSNVTVLTSHPNYPSGKFAPGYRFWRPEKRKEGRVTVWRLPMVPERSQSISRRAISYLFFGLLAMIAAPLVAPKATGVWVYQTPFTMALASWYHKFVRGSRVVFTVADLWPESFESAGVVRSPWIMRASFRFRRWINGWADLVICSTEGTRQIFASEGVNGSRLTRVPVWVDGVPDPLPSGACAREPVVRYAGNIGPAQALDTLVTAAAKLRDEFPHLRFELYGTGSELEKLRGLVKLLGATNIEFKGSVTPNEAFHLASTAAAQVVSLRPAPLFRMTVPSKLIFSFAAGAPILAGLEGEAQQLAESSGAAISYNAANADSLSDAIRSLVAKSGSELTAMGENGQRFYKEHFDRAASLRQYRNLILAPRSAG